MVKRKFKETRCAPASSDVLPLGVHRLQPDPLPSHLALFRSRAIWQACLGYLIFELVQAPQLFSVKPHLQYFETMPGTHAVPDEAALDLLVLRLFALGAPKAKQVQTFF